MLRAQSLQCNCKANFVAQRIVSFRLLPRKSAENLCTLRKVDAVRVLRQFLSSDLDCTSCFQQDQISRPKHPLSYDQLIQHRLNSEDVVWRSCDILDKSSCCGSSVFFFPLCLKCIFAHKDRLSIYLL